MGSKNLGYTPASFFKRRLLSDFEDRKPTMKIVLTVIGLILSTQAASAAGPMCHPLFAGRSMRLMDKASLNPELLPYESAHALDAPNTPGPFSRNHGWIGVARDQQGNAVKGRLHVLVDNPGLNGHVQVIGPFNNWGKNPRPQDTMRPVKGRPEMFYADIDGISHGMQYRIKIDDHEVIDPTSAMYTTPEFLEREGRLNQGDYLNSVFWDFKRPGAYQISTQRVDLRNKPALISEVEAYSLVRSWTDSAGQRGPRTKADTYGFIARSGVIAHLRASGINAVEFLPFNQAVDGEPWAFRYQIFGLFAPDSCFGSPDEFKMMVDEFHRNGIAVVMDTVISHFPFQGNSSPSRQLKGVGADVWWKANGQKLYATEISPWNTFRYDYANPYVRRMLTESLLFMMKEYGLDGIRYDNVDGIRSLNGGEQLLKEINAQVRLLNPSAFLVSEAFDTPGAYEFRMDEGGIGMNTKNDGDTFEIWRSSLAGTTESMDMLRIKNLLNSVWDWKTIAQMRYLTNHDESANGRGGASGSYPASFLGDNPYYVMGKIKMADSFNMLAGAYYLSTPQTRLMQKGTFYDNPSIDWDLAKNDPSARMLWSYFSTLGRFVESKASYFNFASLHRGIENHVDNDNKIISLKRVDPNTGKAMYVVINMGHHEIRQYRFGVSNEGRYNVAFDGDSRDFGGSGHLHDELPGGAFDNDAQAAHGKPHSLIVPVIAPYSVTIFEQQ
jgi:1,4-alpha-glucan branching enzyme